MNGIGYWSSIPPCARQASNPPLSILDGYSRRYEYHRYDRPLTNRNREFYLSRWDLRACMKRRLLVGKGTSAGEAPFLTVLQPSPIIEIR